MKNKIVITGGAGFIGSHLVDMLLFKGYSIICIDDLSSGKKANIAGHINNPNFVFLKQDVSKPIQLKGKVDYVLHFASPASPKDYLQNPLETLKANSLGTLNTLELARKKKAKFLLASTSEVYGDPLVTPQPEGYSGNVNPIGPRSVYDEGKRFAEALTMAYHRKYSLDTKIIRIFNTYGPRMRKDDGRAVSNLINQALLGKPLTIYGNGKQTRSFCFVSDLIEGILRVMGSDIHQPVNLGNPVECSILELATTIARMVGVPLQIKYFDMPQDDPQRRCPDISRAVKGLGWTPKINLQAGLEETIAWFKSH